MARPGLKWGPTVPDPVASDATGTEVGLVSGQFARAGLVGLVALVPTLAAIWLVPWFVTQDGPAHVYNAHVLRELIARGEASPYARAYEARLEPVPNWAGHLALMVLLEVLAPRDADRMMMTLTLLAPTLALVWMWAQQGPSWHTARVGLGAAVLSLNFVWLLGFYSFLLGMAMTFVTWGWASRGYRLGRVGWSWAFLLGVLLCVNYFCHLVSLGLAVGGLAAMAVWSPRAERGERVVWTAVAFVPLVPLGLVYRAMMVRGGQVEPIWENLSDPGSLQGWTRQFLWSDPITVGVKDRVPLLGVYARGAAVFAPLVWTWAGVILAGVSGLLAAGRGGRGAVRSWVWFLLGAGLVVGGVLAPDTLGIGHGFYLTQRLVLVGLYLVLLCGGAGTCAGWSGRIGRAGFFGLMVAWVVQSLVVWDYALYASERVGQFVAAGREVGQNQRIAGLLVDTRGPFRPSPLWHADTILGVGTGNVVWSNYEAAHYYFPVKIRSGVRHPPVEGFEKVSRLDHPGDATERRALWAGILGDHRDDIDALVVWGRSEELEALTLRWFEPLGGVPSGPARVWVRRRLDLEKRTERDEFAIEPVGADVQ